MWRRNPAGDVSILSDAALLEKKRNRYYLVLVSRETDFPGESVEGQGKSSLRAKDRKEDDTNTKQPNIVTHKKEQVKSYFR